MAMTIQLMVPDFVIVGDGVSTVATINLAHLPIAVPFRGDLPDSATVIDPNAGGDPVIPSSLEGSTITLTFASAIAVDTSLTVRIELRFEV